MVYYGILHNQGAKMTKRKKEMLKRMIHSYIGFEPKIELTAEIYRPVQLCNEVRITRGEAALSQEAKSKYRIYEHYRNQKDIVLYGSYSTYEEAKNIFFERYTQLK